MLFGSGREISTENNNNDNYLIKYMWENLSQITSLVARLTIFVGYKKTIKLCYYRVNRCTEKT